jgi:arsenate reductase
MYIVYGIPNCDVIKKVINWFQDKKISYVLHDYKKESISSDTLKHWCKQVGWETIFNKRSTTWKELGETVQSTVTGEDAAIRIMMEHTSIIKRPVIEKNGKVIVVGFDAAKYEKLIR